jgi:hypothetical protein
MEVVVQVAGTRSADPTVRLLAACLELVTGDKAEPLELLEKGELARDEVALARLKPSRDGVVVAGNQKASSCLRCELLECCQE